MGGSIIVSLVPVAFPSALPLEEIPKEDDRRSNLQLKAVERKTSRPQVVEDLCRDQRIAFSL